MTAACDHGRHPPAGFLPAVAGVIVFGVVTGLAVAVSKAPARWMGWVLFVLGVAAAVVPPLSFWAFLAMVLWALAAGIWLTAQNLPLSAAASRRPASRPHSAPPRARRTRARTCR